MKKLLIAALMAATIPCASQVNVQGSNIQIGGAGGGTGNVQPAPQAQVAGYTQSGSQPTVGAGDKVLNYVSPIMSGIGDTNQFINGGGNNGIANFFGTYPTGNGMVPPYSTSTESWTKPPSGGSLDDLRNNVFANLHNNAISGDSYQCSDTFGMGNFHRCDKGYFNLMKPTFEFNGRYCEPNGPGWNIGDGIGLPYAGGWAIRHCNITVANFRTQGIKQGHATWIDSYAGGDVGGHYIYVHCPGGSWDAAAEGCVPGYFNVTETTPYWHGTVTAGSTGATTLTTARTSGAAFPTDGGFLLDISKPFATATAGSSVPGFTTLVSGGTLFMSVSYPSASFPVSTAWGISQAGTGPAANGQYQINVPQTISFTMGAGGAVSVGDHICLLGANNATFTEETAVTSSSGGGSIGSTITLGFTTRKAYGTGFAFMKGGMCGKMLTVTGASNRTAVQVVGATSATNLIITACTHGACTSGALQQSSSDLYQQVISSVGLSHTFYPGAEIVGSANGSSNTLQLGINSVPWTSGDTVESPNPPSVNITAVHAICSQTTTENDFFSPCLAVDYSGAAAVNSVASVTVGPTTGAGIGDLLHLNASEYTHNVNSFIQVDGLAPVQGVINGQALQSGVYIPWLHGSGGNDPVLYSTPTYQWLVTHNGAWTAMNAVNAPPIPDDLDEIPVSIRTGDLGTASDFHNYKVSGDCTMHLGVFTCSGSGGGSGTHQLSVGYITPGATLPIDLFGPVFYEPYAATLKGIQARIVDSGACTGAPVMQLMDLGTSPTTAYGSATSIQSLTTGTSDGVYSTGAVSVTITAGHYYSYAYSAGSCSDTVFNQATATITTSGGGATTFPWSCQPGLGDGTNAIPSGTYLQTKCYNDTGQTVTLTGMKCFTDNSGSSTVNMTNGAGTGLLTGAITCSASYAAGTQSGTTTLAAGDYVKLTFVADGTSKQSSFVVTGTHP